MRLAAGRFLPAILALGFVLAPALGTAQELQGDLFGKRIDKADGTVALTLGQKLPVLWETKFGFDVAFAATADPWAQLDIQQPFASGVPSWGTAWANVALPGFGWDKTEIEARIIPFEERARFGATLSRRVPIGEHLAVTFQNGYALSQRLAAAALAEEAVAAQTFETNQRIGLNFLPTATTVAIGQAFSSNEHQWLRSVSAEQKLFGGPLSLNGAVSETVTGDYAKTIRASFRRKF